MIAVLVLLAFIGGWEAYARLGNVDSLILPAPSEIATALWDDRGLLWSNLLVTGEEVGLGILLALVLGFVLAVALRGSIANARRLEELRLADQRRGRVDAELFDHMMRVLDEEREAISSG